MPPTLKRKKNWLIIVILISLIAVLAYHFLKPNKVFKIAPTHVITAPVVEHNIPLSLTSLGNLIAPEATMLSTEQAGTIKKIYFKNGQHVKQGALLVQLDDTSARSQYDKDKAALVEAEAMYHRYQELNRVDPTVLSKVQMDQVFATYQEAKATLKGDAKILAEMQIRAPFTGILGATNLSIGSYVNVGTEVVAIVNPNVLEVAYPVPEAYYGAVALGQKVSLISDAYPDQKFPGTVIYKAPLVNESSRSFIVRAQVDNPKGLSPGMLIHITQTLIAERNVLAVPTSALVAEVSGFGVYQIQDGKVIETYVKIGPQFGNYTEITDGLKTGDSIITVGTEKVQPGSIVATVSGS